MKKPVRSRKQLPVVLIIDDIEDEAAAAKLALQGSVRAVTFRPEDVTSKALSSAKLVLVDLKLDHWRGRDEQTTPSLKPQDGIALAAILRSNLPSPTTKTPTAFALRSGKLGDISGSLAHEGREHIIAS